MTMCPHLPSFAGRKVEPPRSGIVLERRACTALRSRALRWSRVWRDAMNRLTLCLSLQTARRAVVVGRSGVAGLRRPRPG